MGFTGFGYYYRDATGVNHWEPFMMHLQDMGADQRAMQCHMAMQDVGWNCPASRVELVCFNAGGFPKEPCNRWCDEKVGPQGVGTGVYTVAGTPVVDIYNYYGPYGTGGTYPVYSRSQGTCEWSETSTTVINKVRPLLNSKPGNHLHLVNFSCDFAVARAKALDCGRCCG
eukprot:SAG31_NODE_2807_length_5065_cov_3.438180_5_plen_170_part_00